MTVPVGFDGVPIRTPRVRSVHLGATVSMLGW